MSGYQTETDSGFLLSTREWQVVGTAAALMGLNVVLMWIVATTPLAIVNQYLFATPILGVIVYGAAITAGDWIAERGIEAGNAGMALAGVAVLQLAFGTFGAGIVSAAPRAMQGTVLVLAAVVTAVMTAAIGAYVYARSADFDHYSTYSMVGFIGGIVAIAIGSFVLSELLLLGFVLIFAGFLFRLGWEMWRIREQRISSVSLQAIGLYVAVAGVFVHVLQIVMRLVVSRE